MTGPPPPVQPDAGPMLTCPRCGITSRASRWQPWSSTNDRQQRCPSCDGWTAPTVSTPDHGQRTAGVTASTHPDKHELGVPPTAAERRVPWVCRCTAANYASAQTCSRCGSRRLDVEGGV